MQQSKPVVCQKVGGKHIIEYIDWKESKVYAEYVVKKVNCRQIMDGKEYAHMLKEDEIDYVRLMITKKIKDPKLNQNSPEVVKICEQFIPKALNTIQYLLRELLSDDFYMLEF
jgi:hypothetical protein